MDKLLSKLRALLTTKIGLDGIFRFLLFMIPLIGIVSKGVLFQGFVSSQNPYELNINNGYLISKNYIEYYYAFALAFLSFALLFKGKGRVIYLFIIDFILTILIVGDLGYFRGFLTMPSALLLMQTSNIDNMGSTILSMFSKYDLLFVLDFIVMGLFVLLTKKSYTRTKRRAPISFIIILKIGRAHV